MRTVLGLALISSLCFPCVSTAADKGAGDWVSEARKHLEDLEYQQALKALAVAEKIEGLSRAQLIDILSLQGIVYGVLGKEAKTRDAFRKLLMIDPSAPPPAAEYPPRVQAPFQEAQRWVAAHGPMEVSAQFDRDQPAVRMRVAKDELRQARSVRLYAETASQPLLIEQKLEDGAANISFTAPIRRWWVEVLGERQGVLFELPAQEVAAPPAMVSERAAPSEPPETRAPIAAEKSVAPAPSASWQKPVGAVCMGLGVGAVGMGVLFGVQANATRNEVLAAPRDEFGRITSVTQRDALALENLSRTQAVVANILFGVGAALSGAGLALVVLGPSSGPSLTLSPAPGGAVMTGAF